MPRGAHMTSRYGGKQGMFTAQIEQWQLKTLAAIEQTFKDVVIQVGESIINLTPVDTGRAKANWQLTIDAPANHSLDSYDQEGDETIAELVGRANTLEVGQIAYIVNCLVYALPLEYGHSRKRPGGMVRVTKEKFQTIVRQAVERNR